MAVLVPTPHQEKRAPGKEQRRARETKSGARSRWGQFPLCSVLLGSQQAKGSFLPEKVDGNGKKWEGEIR